MDRSTFADGPIEVLDTSKNRVASYEISKSFDFIEITLISSDFTDFIEITVIFSDFTDFDNNIRESIHHFVYLLMIACYIELLMV